MTAAKAARAVVAGTYRQDAIFILRTCGLVLAAALLMVACSGGGGNAVEAMSGALMCALAACGGRGQRSPAAP
jgi:hypothetical protein